MQAAEGEAGRPEWRLAGAIFLAAVALRLVIAAATRFDGLYGQDPFAYYDFALQLRSALASGQPPPPFFWPIGYPLLIVLSTALVGARPLAGLLISVAAGGAVAALTFLLVQEIRPGARFGGLVAGLLAAAAAQITLSSLSIMSDAAALAWATLSAWALLRYWRRGRTDWLALAALALALAVITRWVYVLLLLPWAAGTLLAWRRARLPGRRAVTATALAAVCGLAVLGAHVAYVNSGRAPQGTAALPRYRCNPEPQAAYWLCQTVAVGVETLSNWAPGSDGQAAGWSLRYAFRRANTSGGLLSYEYPVGLFYVLPALHPAFVFPLFSPFLLLGALAMRRPAAAVLALIFGWPLVGYLFLAGTWANPRFSLIFFPPLLVLVGLGLDHAWRRLKPRWRPWLALWCAVGLAGSLAWTARDLRNFLGLREATLATAAWAEAQLPAGSQVITLGLTHTIDHYTGLAPVDIHPLDEAGLAELLETNRPLFLLLDVANVESQWQGRSPEQNWRWLQENSRLTEVGRFGGYQLYRVEPP